MRAAIFYGGRDIRVEEVPDPWPGPGEVLVGSAGFSELDLAVADNVYPLPDHVSLEVASMLDVYACGVHAINRIPLRAIDNVCVLGTGPIGMTMGQVARAAGARRVIMVGRRD